MVTLYFYSRQYAKWVPLSYEGSGFPMALPTFDIAHEVATLTLEREPDVLAAAIYVASDLAGFYGSTAHEAPDCELDMGYVRMAD